ncbi:MAG: hypothetical protein IKW90_16025 [Lachnospiraceae bacterium]|nr:hypothetical protein [Lachnospiraceae bacterium]
MNIEDIELNPSLGGKGCKGNGEHEGIECQCDECDYLMECFPIKSSSSTSKSLVIDKIAEIINDNK